MFKYILTKFIRTYKTVDMYEMKNTALHFEMLYEGIITSGKLKHNSEINEISNRFKLYIVFCLEPRK